MSRKIRISAGFLLLSSLAVLLFNQAPIILMILLVALAVGKHFVVPIKKELFWFVLVSVGGALVEVVLVNMGNAWTYTNPQFLGIPLYMPIFWGLVGTTTVTLYQELVGR